MGQALELGRTNSCCRQTMPHIGDALTAGGVSWKWYSGGRNDGMVDKEYAACATPTFFCPPRGGRRGWSI
jgi:phospholipase C